MAVISTILWLLTVTCLWHSARALQTVQVCNGEVFSAACEPGHVLWVDSARYGIMELGRCVNQDFGRLGCENDALDVVEHACAGRASCDVTVSNQLRRNGEGACERELAGYAKIAYKCLPVLKLGPQHCHGTEYPLEGATSYLASSSVHAACPSPSKVINLSAQSGQTMNVTLVTFDLTPASLAFGKVKDKLSENIRELESDGARQRHVMETVGNLLQLDLSSARESSNFLIIVQVLGCKDLAPPEGTWVRRNGLELQIGCEPGTKTWTLTCVSNKWQGVMGRCGTELESMNVGHLKQRTKNGWVLHVSEGTLILAVCSAVVLLAACLFLIGVCILHRRRSRRLTKMAEYGAHLHQSVPLMDGPTHLDFSTLPYCAGLSRTDLHSPSRHASSLAHSHCADLHNNNTRFYCPTSCAACAHTSTLPIYRPVIDHVTASGLYNSIPRSYNVMPMHHMHSGDHSSAANGATLSMDNSIDLSNICERSERSESVKYYILDNSSGQRN